MRIVSLSQVWVTQYDTINEKLFLGMTMALVGMVIVFLMLIVIVIAIIVMSKTLRSLQKNSLRETPLSSSTPVLSGDGYSAADSLLTEAGTMDHSLVAVITAAVAMMLAGQSGSTSLYPGFRVRSIRRIR